MTPQIAPALDLRPGTMSESSRLFSIWVQPSKTFEDISQRPTFLFPLILAAATAVLYLLEFARPAFSGGENQAILEVAGAAAGVAVRAVAMAAVLAIVVAKVYSAPVPFPALLAIVAYSMMPGVAIGLIAAGLMKLQLAAGAAPHYPIVTNLAVWLNSAATSKFAYSLARSLDLVTLWQLALIAQGLKIAAGGRLSNGAAFRAVLFPWAIYIVAKAAAFAQ